MSRPPDAATAGRLLASSISGLDISHLEEITGLFGSLRNPLLRYLLTFAIPAHDCEEIVQETFLALFNHLESGKSRANLPGWIFRVGHNLALKHLEKARPMRSAVAVESDSADWYVDSGPNPEEQLVHTQTQAKLQAVLRALPEQDRCCICLRAEGLRYREIAEILGMSLGAVSISLARSLARFERSGQE
jgi:RNA polymerase sigma-70 factor (ECF subfamily)